MRHTNTARDGTMQRFGVAVGMAACWSAYTNTDVRGYARSEAADGLAPAEVAESREAIAELCDADAGNAPLFLRLAMCTR